MGISCRVLLYLQSKLSAMLSTELDGHWKIRGLSDGASRGSPAVVLARASVECHAGTAAPRLARRGIQRVII